MMYLSSNLTHSCDMNNKYTFCKQCTCHKRTTCTVAWNALNHQIYIMAYILSIDLNSRFCFSNFHFIFPNIMSVITQSFRRKRVYSKAAGNWSTRPVKKPKEYTYITGLITEVINEFTIGKKRISDKCEQLPEDPKRIRSTIAPVTPPPTSILRDQHVSRLRKAKK
jgi:hypothetical protein